MAQNTNDYEGVLLIDKPSGITSHDIVDRVRRKLRMKRVGHAGTLDPLATGLMIILVGKATKISQYLTSLDKEYEGTIKFGESTNTQDADGDVVEARDVPNLTEDEILDYMDGFIGDQYQTPPMFSAKKVDGVPLYKLARKGKEIEREPRFVSVRSFDLLEYKKPLLEFRMLVSKGTYVRTIAHDMGEKIGCGAHLTELRRTMIDKFDIDDSVTLEAFEALEASEVQRRLIPIYQAVPANVL